MHFETQSDLVLMSPPPPTHAEIARRAYEIHLDRQGGPGDALSDWLQAERELTARAARAAATQTRPRRASKRPDPRMLPKVALAASG